MIFFGLTSPELNSARAVRHTPFRLIPPVLPGLKGQDVFLEPEPGILTGLKAATPHRPCYQRTVGSGMGMTSRSARVYS